MSGQLFVVAPGALPARRGHIHVRWALEGGAAMLFRDPRRFGGVWTYDSLGAMRRERWGALGPDALRIGARPLGAALAGSRRHIKACLLDQRVLAGVGNIYADESLFLAGVHPRRRADRLGPESVSRLAASIRRVLREAVAARGSSLRDFLDADLREGQQQTRFRVYGRAGAPCPGCGNALSVATVGGRTSTYCPLCQPAGRNHP